jgi:uncharacterized protein
MVRAVSLLRLLAPLAALSLAACSASCSQASPGGGPAAAGPPATAAAPPAPGAHVPSANLPGSGETTAGADDPSGGAAEDQHAPAAGSGEEALLPAEITTVGWDGLSNSPIVLLRELTSGKVVPIWVGIAEARAIASALHGVEFPRPMTHDLMRNLLTELGGELLEVRIHDVHDGTYYGLLKLKVAGRKEPVMVDTRPSDGMALALRTGAAIRVSQRVLDRTPDYEFLAPEAGEQVVRSLGLTLVAPTAELRQEFGLPEGAGLVVTQAVGEAGSQGMRRGDFVLEVNGTTPESPVDFLDTLHEASPSAPVAITYWRDGEKHSVELIPQLPEPPEEERPKQIA